MSNPIPYFPPTIVDDVIEQITNPEDDVLQINSTQEREFLLHLTFFNDKTRTLQFAAAMNDKYHPDVNGLSDDESQAGEEHIDAELTTILHYVTGERTLTAAERRTLNDGVFGFGQAFFGRNGDADRKGTQDAWVILAVIAAASHTDSAYEYAKEMVLTEYAGTGVGNPLEYAALIATLDMLIARRRRQHG